MFAILTSSPSDDLKQAPSGNSDKYLARSVLVMKLKRDQRAKNVISEENISVCKVISRNQWLQLNMNN